MLLTFPAESCAPGEILGGCQLDTVSYTLAASLALTFGSGTNGGSD